MCEAVFVLNGPEDTVHLGRLLGEHLSSGDVVALKGDLGAGKTCLTGGLAQGLGLAEDEPVVSPSFVLAHEYQGRVTLFHLDLYRLEEEDFFLSGLDEYLLRPGVTVLEWAEKIEAHLPVPRLEVELVVLPAGGRKAVLRAVGPKHENTVREVAAQWDLSRSL